MKLHPYHDANGVLWPELDNREVSVAVFCQYLGLSRWRATLRARRGDFGRTQTEGAWFQKARTGSGGEWRFRPAVIFRRLRMGRFSAVDFDPRQFDGRIRIYHCDPAHTAAADLQRQRDAATTGLPTEVQELIRTLAGTTLGLTALVRQLTPPPADNLSFPAERHK